MEKSSIVGVKQRLLSPYALFAYCSANIIRDSERVQWDKQEDENWEWFGVLLLLSNCVEFL